jgi:hypothetical protein
MRVAFGAICLSRPSDFPNSGKSTNEKPMTLPPGVRQAGNETLLHRIVDDREAEDNPRTLLNLRKRMAKIRVFDPACGSGNFLVIAYKEMRAIEAEINKRRLAIGWQSTPSSIKSNAPSA